jgi:cbb3-type cytochrome oxidase maturation protein
MEILYLLIPLSALLVLMIIGVFGWALHGGQFDDLDREGERILNAADGEALTVIKLDESSAPNNAPRVDSH